eukprot:5413921-Lingulodinium_polyedra.AAC.1
MKKRIIVDSHQSNVAPVTTKPKRIVLPRLLDVVNNTLHQQEAARGRYDRGIGTEYVVLDFSDAFFMLPLRPSERKFFVICFRQ